MTWCQAGDKPLPDPMMTQTYYATWHHLATMSWWFFWQPLLLFVVDGGMSLLKNPSAAMAKLIQSAEKSVGKPGGAERALVRPVMAFVTERHDLEGLQLAMRQALRKAACRVFALQVNTDTRPWDQFHKRLSCSCENKRFPYLNNNEKIRSQFCTYHNSFTFN